MNKVVIGGKEYVYPDWTLGTIQKIIPLSEELAGLSTTDVANQLRIMAKMLSIALRRDYPEVTEDFVNDWLSVDEIDRISEVTVIQMDKLSKKKNPEMSTQMTNQLIGEEFMPELSPVLDGVGNT